MRYKLFLLSVLVLLGCKKNNTYPNIDILGHGGNGIKIENSIYHDNSLEAIDFAMNMQNVNGVELDVQLSITNEIWLFHDEELSNETSGQGCVNAKGDEYLASLNYATLKKEKLVRLKDVPFEKYPGKTFVLDARHFNKCSSSVVDLSVFVNRIKEVVDANENCNFIVNIHPTAWGDLWTGTGINLLYEVPSYGYFDNLEINSNLVRGVVIRNSVISKEEITLIHNAGMKVYLFEVRAPKRIREALKKGPDAIITDDLRAAIIEKGE